MGLASALTTALAAIRRFVLEVVRAKILLDNRDDLAAVASLFPL
jgi:hypothetical protein